MTHHPTRLRLDDGVELFAYPSGPEAPDAPTVVLLHGIGMTHLTFADVQPLLARSLPVVSFDLPGFGRSPRPERPFAVADHARAVDAALDRLGVGRRLLVGHSMGVQFCVEHARLRPDVVAGLVLVGPVVDPNRCTLAAQAGDLASDLLHETAGANARVLVDYVRGGLRWYLTNLAHMFAYPTQERVRDVRCPVVVVRGEHDPVAREPWCRSLAAAAAGPAEFVTVPGRAHAVPLTAPGALAGIICAVVGRPS